MFCKNCGAEITGTNKFCPKCGTLAAVPAPEPVAASDVFSAPAAEKAAQAVRQEPPPPKKKKKGKKKWVALLILILVVLLAGGTGAVYWTAPANQVVRALNSGEYASAVEIYNEDVAGNFLWRGLAARMLSGFAEDTLSAYNSGDLTYEETAARLNALSSFNDEELSRLALSSLTELAALENSQMAYEEAEALYAAGEYVDALELYTEVAESSPVYEDAQDKLNLCKTLYIADVLEKTADPESQSDYRQMLQMIDLAVSVFPDDTELLQRQNELTQGYQALVKSEAMTSASDAVADGNYETAFSVLQSALKTLPDDSDLKNLLSSAQSSYEDSIVSQVDALVSSGDYDSALSLLTAAKNVLPSSTVISDLYDTTKTNQPVALSSLKITESGGNYALVTDQVVTTDTIGNIYSPGNLYQFWGGSGGYVKYYLGGEYTTLQFTLAVSDGDEGRLNPTELTVYGNNDEILYTSGELTRTTTPQTVSVNIAGQNWLYIRSSGSSYYHDVSLLVADPMLYK